MTTTELLEKIDEYRKEYMSLFEQVGIGGSGYSSGGTLDKYSTVKWSYLDKEENRYVDKRLTYTYEDVQAQIEYIHCSILSTINSFKLQNGHLKTVAKMVIKNLLARIEQNCSEEYLNTVKNSEEYSTLNLV